MFLIIIIVPLLLGISFNSPVSTNLSESEVLKTSRIEEYNNVEWLENSNFDNSGTPWFSSIEGDNTDLIPSINAGQADYEINGDIKTFSEISGTPTSADWTLFNHSIRPLPLTYEINEFGLNVSHVYDEDAGGDFPNSGDQTANLAAALWKRNVSLAEDMSDYVITSASINAVVNGSADMNIETPTDHPPFAEGGYASLFDFARFYIEISDLNNLESYEIAYNKTLHLGLAYADRRVYNSSSRNYMSDTNMTTVDEDILIFALTQVLRHDNHNFTITLGIDVDSEDNYPGYELDVWYSLLIKSCDLTFTYEKKIDKSTALSFDQVGDQITGTNVKIKDGNISFKYKIDQPWPTFLSPNSEIRVLINDKPHSETIKLSLANSTFQPAKIGGYNITSLLNVEINISISIQVFIADEFNLDRDIIISIDEVVLLISYSEEFPDPLDDPWIATAFFILTSAGVVTLGVLLIAYIKVWRFPLPVRKVRKFGKALTNKKKPDVKIIGRKGAFEKTYNEEVSKTSKLLKGSTGNEGLTKPKLS
jgi:hypothetical protein